MGTLIATEFMTLDGVAQAPGGPDEDPQGEFTHGGWQAPWMTMAAGAAVFRQAENMDALLLGRKTYDIFAGYWPTAPVEMPYTGLLNRVPKYVASCTLTSPLAWDGAELLAGDLAQSIDEVKARHDEVHVIGSLDLLQSLLRLNLVDRLNLWQYPLLLGSGKRVFADGTVPAALDQTESVTHSNGVLQLTYEFAGLPTYGDMTVDDETTAEELPSQEGQG